MTVVERLRKAGCVFAEDEAALLNAAADSPPQLEAFVARRIAGEPLEVIVGWAEFRGLRIVIESGVFVPRRRTTGFLAERAIALSPAVALDLCCGSGAVAASILDAVPGVEVYAADIDPAAVHCARRNLPVGRVFEGDLFDALPTGMLFDLIVANAPYVPTDSIALMPPEARDFEPLVTLDGGSDGLDVHRRIAAGAAARLRENGALLIEVSDGQADEAIAIFEANGLGAQTLRDDEVEATVVMARLP